MKKILFALTALTAMVGSAHALSTNGTAWSCNANANSGSAAGQQYCVANVTSATTATQLGRLSIYPSKMVYLVNGVSGTAVANVVTPTFTLYLGNKAIATQSVSVSTAGNVVTLGTNGVPYFDGLSVSQSVPSQISQTNALSIGVIESTRIQTVQ